MNLATSLLHAQALMVGPEQPIIKVDLAMLSEANLAMAITFAIIGASLLAGLAAAYGRELQTGRQVARSWWIARCLLLPMLTICALSASAALELSRTMTAFTSAMLALGGYDGLSLIEARWRDRALGERPSSDGEITRTMPRPPTI